MINAAFASVDSNILKVLTPVDSDSASEPPVATAASELSNDTMIDDDARVSLRPMFAKVANNQSNHFAMRNLVERKKRWSPVT